MNREKLIKALKKYCKKNDIYFDVDKKRGKGSHYWVYVGDKQTTIQMELTPLKIENILKQLGIDPAQI